MSVQSLLRVMVLRDAAAIILESGKVPSLRRKGNVEGLAVPPIGRPLRSVRRMPAGLRMSPTTARWPHAVFSLARIRRASSGQDGS